MSSSPDITRLLIAYGEGQQEALEQVFPMIYDHLKRLAHNRLRDERPDHTINTTGLVHEAYLKLVDINRVTYENRGHFFAMASRVMRRILINYAEADRRAQKRGGGVRKEALDEERLMPDSFAAKLLDLNDALERMKTYPRPAQALAHHYFGGLTHAEIAEALAVSTKTVQRDLRFARAWLTDQWQGDLMLP